MGPEYSKIDEKQKIAVSLIKRYEIAPQIKLNINLDIQGLRKKKKILGVKPNNQRWWKPFVSYERNGYLNIGLSRNWTRLMFPMVPLFLFFYAWQPIIHGHIYI